MARCRLCSLPAIGIVAALSTQSWADPAQPIHRPLKAHTPADSRPIWFGISTLASVHHNRLDEIDSALQAHGYSTVGTNQPIYGFGLEGGWRRLRVAVDLGIYGSRSLTSPQGQSLSVYQASVSLDAGFDLLQYRGLSLFPMLGIAGGDLRLQYDPSTPPLLGQQVQSYFAEREIRRNTRSVRALFGIEQRVVLWDRTQDQLLLVVGLRLGWVQQISQSQWMFTEPSIADLQGGPAVDTSGPFMRWGIGLAGSSK